MTDAFAYVFQDQRFVGEAPKFPLAAGSYKTISDWWGCDRRPRVGESATQYAEYARQDGTLIKTTDTIFRVEA